MKIAFVASPEPGGQNALKELSDGYGQAAVAEAEFIVALGGDHMALEALQHAVACRQSRYTPCASTAPPEFPAIQLSICCVSHHAQGAALIHQLPPRLRHDRPNGGGDDP